MATVICQVANAGKRAILFLPRDAAALPKGELDVRVDGRVMVASVAKIAVNVLRQERGGPNVLTATLQGWFGPAAGMPGSQRHKVQFRSVGPQWVLEPVTPCEAKQVA